MQKTIPNNKTKLGQIRPAQMKIKMAKTQFQTEKVRKYLQSQQVIRKEAEQIRKLELVLN